MIFVHQVILALFTGAAAAAAAVSTEAKANFSAKSPSKFLSAMKSANLDSHLSGRDLQNNQTPSFAAIAGYINGGSDKSRSLRNRMLAKAKYVSPEEIKEREARELGQNYVNSKYNYNNANSGSSYYTTNGGGDSSSYSVASGAWNNAFGFDATQYSFSYQRCAEVRQFDDVLAAQENSTTVFVTKHFAVFRFCPSKTCEGMTEEDIEAEREAQYQEYVKNLNAEKAQYQAVTYAQYKNGNSYVSASQYVKQQAAAAQASGVSYEPPAWYFDKRVIGGANGSGCSSNYGEYMLELEDFLKIMAEYHAERFKVYCTYCEKCMYNAYNKWLNSQGRALEAKSIDEDWKEDFERHEDDRELKDINYYAACPEYDTCKYYKNLCKAGFDSSIEKYFTCTKVQRSNGRDAYIGPHCSDDGSTVTLGIYSDENCYEYIGNRVNVNNYLGFQLDKNALEGYVTGSLARDVIPDDYFEKYWSDELQAFYDPQEQLCIPCAASMQIYQNKGNIYQQGSGNDYRNSNKQYGDKVNGLCHNLYMASARCDKHYQSYNSRDKNSKISNYFNRMELSCDFIESVIMGNYNEMGFLNIYTTDSDPSTSSGGNLLTSSIIYEEYGHYVREISGLQVFGLCASILACVILGIWSLKLTRSLAVAKTPWRPRRASISSSPPTEECNKRKDSGIVSGQSEARSTSYYMY